MTPEDKNAARDTSNAEPPEIYIPACGALCDIFWWARRNPPAEPPALPPVKDETP
jgi:hypothetical protein